MMASGFRLQAAATPGEVEGRRGFSLIELTVAIVVLTVVIGAMTQFMSMMQQRYTREQRVAGVNQTGKTVLDLLALDIGQAGFYPSVVPNTTTSGTIAAPPPGTASPIAVSVTPSTERIYQGAVVLIDTGTLQEVCDVSAVTSTSITVAPLLYGHASGVWVRDSGVPYAQGIMFSATDTALTSNPNRLRIFGDLRGDGTLRFVEYIFTPAATPTDCTGTLTRSDSSALAASRETAVTVADNLCNDGGLTPSNPVFCYGSPAAPAPCAGSGGQNTTFGVFTYVTGVGVNLIMRTQQPLEGPGGGPRTVAMRQTFVPRNILDALRVAAEGNQRMLPEMPCATYQLASGSTCPP